MPEFGWQAQWDRGDSAAGRQPPDHRARLTEILAQVSRDVLQAVARDGEPHQIMISLGYSGWGAGQLENELAQNAWLTVPAEPFILFDLPCEERLPSAMEMLGIDFIHLTGQAGHA